MTFNRSTTARGAVEARPRQASRRHRALLPVALVLIAGTLLVTAPRLVGAQSSPSPVPDNGIKKETLGQGASAVAPGRDLILARRTFAPGADSGAHPAAGPVVLYVESGDVTFEVKDGAALLARAGAKKTESVAAGGEVTLNAGDEVTYDQGVVHDVYNEGSVPAVTLEARLNPNTDAATATPKP